MSLHQDLYTIWNNYYLHIKGCKYRWTSRDESHLKHIRQGIEERVIDICKADQVQQKNEIIAAHFRGLLKQIKDDAWLMAHLELRIIDTMFNQIWSSLNRKFPTYYNKEFEKQLEKDHGLDMVMKYHRYLIDLGWIHLPAGMSSDRWIEPQLN